MDRETKDYLLMLGAFVVFLVLLGAFSYLGYMGGAALR